LGSLGGIAKINGLETILLISREFSAEIAHNQVVFQGTHELEE
jgi:hypothetical protein